MIYLRPHVRSRYYTEIVISLNRKTRKEVLGSRLKALGDYDSVKQNLEQDVSRYSRRIYKDLVIIKSINIKICRQLINFFFLF